MSVAATKNMTPAIIPSRTKRTPRSRTTVVGGGILLLAVVVFGGMGMSKWLGSGAGDLDSPDLHRVVRESFQVAVSASGELEAENQTEIRSLLESPADIVEIVEEGIHATKGQTLIRLNDEAVTTRIEDQMLNVEAARNDLIAAENALAIQINDNDAALRKSKLKVEIAQIDLEKWEKGDVVKRRLELSANLEKAKRDSKRLTEKLVRSKDLYARSFLSKDELQQDEIAALSAAATLERFQMDSEVYEKYDFVRDQKKKTSDLEEAKAELERAAKLGESRLASKAADLNNRKRQLSIREVRLAKLREQLEACILNATTDGLVVFGTSIGNNRYFSGNNGVLQIGRTVRPNELLIVLPDTTSMVATVRVHESVAGRIHLGQPVIVRVDAIRDTVFTGTVKSVGVLAENGGWRDPNLREYTVKVALDGGNPGQKLKPSMRADAEIILASVEDVIAAPVQAIFHDGPISYVYTKKGSRFVKTPVRTARRSSTMAEITAGLEVGQMVLLREPTPGEVIAGEFDPAALAAVMPVGGSSHDNPMGGARAHRNPEGESGMNVADKRSNPKMSDSVREKLKNMSEEDIKKTMRQRRGSNSSSSSRGRPSD